MRLTPEDWHLGVTPDGQVTMHGQPLIELARQFGTPLHVVDEDQLKRRAQEFLEVMRAAYPGEVNAYFALKSNNVSGVVDVIHGTGFRTEVLSPFELYLARRLGFPGSEIIVNGPSKTPAFIRACLEEDVRFIVLDGIHELATIAQEAERAQKEAHLLVRVNPDYEQAEAPASLNFASRVTAPFGLDLQGDELERALDYVRNHPWLRFHGFHMHLGSGLRETRHYQAALGVVGQLRERAMSLEMPIRVLDVGGGFHSRNQRMMNGDERSRYATHDELPESIITSNDASLEDFATTISSCVLRYFEKDELPELVYEPGRSIVGPCQHLLLTVNGVKSRPGCRPWVTTDGGIYTTTAPTLWVLHEVLLCNDANRPLAEPVNLTGSLCATGDIIYRNKPMPRLEPGETIAIMDVGAYFLQFECNFGFPRPAVVGVRRGQPHLLRDRESYDDMVARDRLRPRD